MVALLLLVAVLAPTAATTVAAESGEQDKAATPEVNAPALPGFTRDWRDNEAWYDGKAEVAVYDATRVIYGQRREYQARLFTNKEYVDPFTRTKATSQDVKGAFEVFKHHMREDIPTENYTYHYSTMAYAATSDLRPVKLDMGSQEDCGATFKQFWLPDGVNREGGGDWVQHSYFPREGRAEGVVVAAADPDATPLVFQDTLSLVLRGYSFESPPESLKLRMIPDQTWTHLTDAAPVEVSVQYVGRETLTLPIGEIEAHHVRVPLQAGAASAGDSANPGVDADGTGMIQHDYWFATDGSAPMLHALVQYAGPDPAGNPVTLRLRSLDRAAYWARGGGE